MHPFLFRIGTFPFGTYGLLVVIGFFCALALAMHLARKQNLSSEAVYDLAITVLLAGLVGSRLLMVIVDLASGTVGWSQVFSLDYLRAGGAVHGGIIAATAAFFWRLRRWKLPVAQTADVFATAVPLGQALGRLGCFAAGCCYGTECHLPWAVTFTNPDAQLTGNTPLHTPLHPVQLYTAAANLCVLGLLLLLRRRKTFPGMIISAYFILEGLARIIVETWRGDLDRGVWMHVPGLSTGRLTGIAFVLFGVGLGIWMKRRAAAAEGRP